MEKNDDLMKEIQESIKKNLPLQVGEELKKVIEQGKIDAAKVKQLTTENTSLNSTINSLNTRLTEYAKLDERNAGLEAREKKVIEDERDIKYKTFEYQLNAEKEKTQFAKDVALGLVRNTEYRRKLFDNTNEPYKDQFGCIQYMNKSQNSEENTKAE